MKSLFSLIAIAALTTSCVDGEGFLNVSKDITLVGKKGKTVTFEEGSYRTKIDFKKKLFSGKKQIILKANGKDKVIVDVPKRARLPRGYGELELKASETNQNYDIVAKTNTTFSRSDTYYSSERCYVRMSYKACVLNDEGQRRMVTRSESLSGRRRIEYHYSGERTEFDVELFTADSTENVANFKGTQSSSSRVIDFRGRCNVRPSERDRFRRLAERARRCPRPSNN